MKKNLFIILLLFAIVFLPLTVNADRVPIHGKVFSEEPTVGSRIFVEIYQCYDNDTCDGTIKYDPNLLEFESISIDFPYYIDDIGPDAGVNNPRSVKVVSNSQGNLKIDYSLNESGQTSSSVIAKFIIKNEPSSGKLELSFIPDNPELVLGNGFKKEINIIKTNKNGNCPICEEKKCNCQEEKEQSNSKENNIPDEKKEVNCPKCEKSKCNSNNLFTIIGIISLILNVLLIITIIVLLIKKNSKKIIVDKE